MKDLQRSNIAAIPTSCLGTRLFRRRWVLVVYRCHCKFEEKSNYPKIYDHKMKLGTLSKV